MLREPGALHRGNCRKGQCARRRGRDEFKQTKKAPPWGGPVCGRSLGIPGVAPPCRASACRNLRCWGGAMYEAHRSWQLPGQCRAAIIMYAAHNGIWRSPALLLVCVGASLRRAVTPRFAAVFTTQDAAAIPWPALPALRCPQRSSRCS